MSRNSTNKPNNRFYAVTRSRQYLIFINIYKQVEKLNHILEHK